jgi:hypothetical protein
MKLTPEQEKQLAMYTYFQCVECGEVLSKNYCGKCDEYYNSGHSRNCSRLADPRNQHDH